MPSLVDELPLIALAACIARGTTRVRGAEELRVKESNRLETVAELLRTVGGHVRVDRTTAGRSAACRAACDGGRGRGRTATTASACSARWPASPRSTAS